MHFFYCIIRVYKVFKNNQREETDFFEKVDTLTISIDDYYDNVQLSIDSLVEDIKLKDFKVEVHISELPDSDAGVVPDTFAMRFSRV